MAFVGGFCVGSSSASPASWLPSSLKRYVDAYSAWFTLTVTHRYEGWLVSRWASQLASLASDPNFVHYLGTTLVAMVPPLALVARQTALPLA